MSNCFKKCITVEEYFAESAKYLIIDTHNNSNNCGCASSSSSSSKSSISSVISSSSSSSSKSSISTNPLLTANAIREESLLSNDDPIGHPLPLMTSWTDGSLSSVNPDGSVSGRGRGWHPNSQMALIEAGRHILPWFGLGTDGYPGDTYPGDAYWDTAIVKARELNLPINFISSQWESILSGEPFNSMPIATNPNIVNRSGAIQFGVSPFGALSAWYDAGKEWTETPRLQQLQTKYPDPPLVIFMSNNEHKKLYWEERTQENRYDAWFDSFTLEQKNDTNFLRTQWNALWNERYSALFQGMRDGLINQTWKDNARFFAYGAFGPPHFARWGGWNDYGDATADYVSPGPLLWDGGSPNYYTNNWDGSTDFIQFSPQIESMNFNFMKEEAHELNPDFWFELSVWDGYVGPEVAFFKLRSTTNIDTFTIMTDDRIKIKLLRDILAGTKSISNMKIKGSVVSKLAAYDNSYYFYSPSVKPYSYHLEHKSIVFFDAAQHADSCDTVMSFASLNENLLNHNAQYPDAATRPAWPFERQAVCFGDFYVEQELSCNLPAQYWDHVENKWQNLDKCSKRYQLRKQGQIYNPARYKGFAQFGMWLNRPRAVRDYRGFAEYWDDYNSEPSNQNPYTPEYAGPEHILEGQGPYFLALLEAVDAVHDDPVLREWWRHGTLVHNEAHPHPYSFAVPAKYQNIKRWYLLDFKLEGATSPSYIPTNTGPNSGQYNQIAVFALAYVRGVSPNREWMIYAHSPLEPRTGVKITIPDINHEITMDVSVEGNFYFVSEFDLQ